MVVRGIKGTESERRRQNSFRKMVSVELPWLILLVWLLLIPGEVVPESSEKNEIGSGTGVGRGAASSTKPNGTVHLPVVSQTERNSSFQVSPELLDKAYSYLKNSATFKDYTRQELNEILTALDTWEPPGYFQERFAYYQSGFDYDERPVWISELGKYNMREVVEKGPEMLAVFDKYVLQAAFNVLKSIHEQSVSGHDVHEAVFLIDYEGLDMNQLTHIPTVTFALRVARIYSDALSLALGRCIVINANYVGELGVNLLRPILGGVLERVEVFGTNKSRWLPELRKIFPPSALPPWYGGAHNFTPVKIFG